MDTRLDQGEVWEKSGHECAVQRGLRQRLLRQTGLGPGLQPRQQVRLQHEPQRVGGRAARVRGEEDLQHAVGQQDAAAQPHGLRLGRAEEDLDPRRAGEDGQRQLHRQNTFLSKVGRRHWHAGTILVVHHVSINQFHKCLHVNISLKVSFLLTLKVSYFVPQIFVKWSNCK